MARSVCEADPRTIDERRANALDRRGHPHRIRLHVRPARLHGRPTGDAPAKNAVVYVVADEESVDAATAAQESDAATARDRP